MANAFTGQQPTTQQPIETDTSGCAGRRRRSAATGGGTHTPRWRFMRGSPEPSTPPKNRHEWVCGPTTLERSDRRRLAYPEMAVYEGEFKGTHITKQPRNRHKEESSTKLTPPTAPPAAPPTPWRPKSPTPPTPWSPSAPRKTKTSPTATPTTNPKTAATAKPTHPPLGRPAS